MTDTWKTFGLPENFNPAEDDSLQNFLSESTKFPVRIDAAKLRRLDTMVVELLLCAARSWQGRKLNFEVIHVSAEIEEVFVRLGITADLLARSVLA